LIEKHGPDRVFCASGEATKSFVLVPLTKGIRAEMTDNRILFVSGDEIYDRQAEADRDPRLGFEDRPHLPSRSAPSLAWTIEVPGTLHLEMRVKNYIALDAKQDVLPERRDLFDRSPREIERRVTRHPEVRLGELFVRECVVQPGRSQIDGVSLRHAAATLET
jgi:hypothetical protein